MAVNIREIKQRIKSVKNTHQITKAMEMVSSAKFKKYNKFVLDSRPYSENLENILAHIAAGVENEHHPLFDGKKEVKKIGIIAIASDRGLCGSYNHSITKELEKFIKENPDKEVSVISVGRKVRDFCKKKDYDMKAEYIQIVPEIMFTKAKEISENIVDFFYEDIFDEVYLLYTKFYSVVNYQVKLNKILPIEKVETKENISYIFEPSEEAILDTLLPKYLNINLYQSLLESTASEHASRMRAMKSASDNAEDMTGKLTLSFNRARQANITQEISEIVSGVEALK
ncbi:ATP synthase F1 subunit gamma [Haliovirga abyssi]|uniref:ATP synthase gamma chain n=1 Tax=Haliovirga abyssi TaxID=2996794 RepID=A0AAU9D204_9FUSO|nr:ATP synthase F1 subunit gamma [Haliovirga abyssi]BDU50014.1 ATP synthase gamma chain [Haliovirga abyssi]